MSVNAQIELPAEMIVTFCRKWQIDELALFGSVLRDDFRPDSDIDVLVGFMPEVRPGILDLMQMKRQLVEIFGRNVDLVEKRAIEEDRNYIRRRHILQSAEVIYGS